MDWRRWDSLEQQSKPIISHHRMKIPIVKDVQPKESLTRLISSREYTIGPNTPRRTVIIKLESKPNLDPFREPRSKGWLSNEQYANLLAQRAVLQ
jgi:hypothetical protein